VVKELISADHLVTGLARSEDKAAAITLAKRGVRMATARTCSPTWINRAIMPSDDLLLGREPNY